MLTTLISRNNNYDEKLLPNRQNSEFFIILNKFVDFFIHIKIFLTFRFFLLSSKSSNFGYVFVVRK